MPKKKNNEKENLWLAVVAIYVVGAFAVFNLLNPIIQENNLSSEISASVIQSVQERQYDFEISAEGAYVFDITNNSELFGKNENAILPLASLTKIMTAVVALENLPENLTVTITKDALGMPGDNGLLLDEMWNLKELIIYMLIASSNDAASAIEKAGNEWLAQNSESEKNFLDYMNEKAQTLGLDQTIFRNTTGLETTTGELGGEGTAKELATLFIYALDNHFDVFGLSAKQAVRIDSRDTNHTIENTNINIDRVPGLLMSKTGYTDRAKGSLAIIYNRDIHRAVFIGVLGSTFSERFSDVQTIIDGLKNE